MDGYAATRAIREREARRRRGGCRSSRSPRTRCARTSSAAASRAWTTSSPSRSRSPRSPTRSSAPSAPAAGAEHRRRRRRRPAPTGGVDMEALASLQEDLGGPDALARIVRLFLEQLDPQAEQIDASAPRRRARGARARSPTGCARAPRRSARRRWRTCSPRSRPPRCEGDAAACDQLAATFAAQVGDDARDLRGGARRARRRSVPADG